MMRAASAGVAVRRFMASLTARRVAAGIWSRFALGFYHAAQHLLHAVFSPASAIAAAAAAACCMMMLLPLHGRGENKSSR
jgi:hypothetical protein